MDDANEYVDSRVAMSDELDRGTLLEIVATGKSARMPLLSWSSADSHDAATSSAFLRASSLKLGSAATMVTLMMTDPGKTCVLTCVGKHIDMCTGTASACAQACA